MRPNHNPHGWAAAASCGVPSCVPRRRPRDAGNAYEGSLVMEAPSRELVHERLLGLLSGRFSPDEVAEWAAPWVRDRNSGFVDPVVWRALIQLSGADVRESPVEYLHSVPDFQQWLSEFELANS
jgi:hypothetical protein